MEANKKFKKSPIVTELILTERKLNILLVLISQSCFKVTKNMIQHMIFCHENTQQKITPTNSIISFG